MIKHLPRFYSFKKQFNNEFEKFRLYIYYNRENVKISTPLLVQKPILQVEKRVF